MTDERLQHMAEELALKDHETMERQASEDLELLAETDRMELQ